MQADLARGVVAERMTDRGAGGVNGEQCGRSLRYERVVVTEGSIQFGAQIVHVQFATVPLCPAAGTTHDRLDIRAGQSVRVVREVAQFGGGKEGGSAVSPFEGAAGAGAGEDGACGWGRSLAPCTGSLRTHRPCVAPSGSVPWGSFVVAASRFTVVKSHSAGAAFTRTAAFLVIDNGSSRRTSRSVCSRTTHPTTIGSARP